MTWRILSCKFFVQSAVLFFRVRANSIIWWHLRGGLHRKLQLAFGDSLAFTKAMTNEEQNWRKLCALVAEEQDPERLSQLVEELIKALDFVKRDLERYDLQVEARTGGVERSEGPG